MRELLHLAGESDGSPRSRTERESRVVVAIGVEGSGKSTLLRALREAPPAGSLCVPVPIPTLEPADFVRWCLHVLGESPTRTSMAALQHRAECEVSRSGHLLLLIDDAHRLPLATAEALGELLRSTSAGLRIVAVGDSSAEFEAVLEALDPAARRVELPNPGLGYERVLREMQGALNRPGAPVSTIAPVLAQAAAAPSPGFGPSSGSGPSFAGVRVAGRALLAAALLAVVVAAPLPLAVSVAPAPAAPPTELRPTPASLAPAPSATQEPPSAAAPPVVVRDVAAAPAVVASPPPAPRATHAPPPTRRAPPVVAPVRVVVNAHPRALITADGRDVGATPLADLRLTPGRHHFAATLADGRVVEREVEVAGEIVMLFFP